MARSCGTNTTFFLEAGVSDRSGQKERGRFHKESASLSTQTASYHLLTFIFEYDRSTICTPSPSCWTEWRSLG